MTFRYDLLLKQRPAVYDLYRNVGDDSEAKDKALFHALSALQDIADGEAMSNVELVKRALDKMESELGRVAARSA
jgi:hypothetical protein